MCKDRPFEDIALSDPEHITLNAESLSLHVGRFPFC